MLLDGRDLETAQLQGEGTHSALATRSPAMQRFATLLREAARHDAPVLLFGETGTGKTTFAGVLHALSTRAGRSYVRVDCSAGTSDFSAPARAAHHGTLFLDEVAELEASGQSALLRLLQSARAPRFRLVASTRPELERKTTGGVFRKDLFYRLSVLELRIPPLRERSEDIVPLAHAFVASLARTEGSSPPELSPGLERALVRYPWPGNVQELRSTLQRMLILSPGERLDVDALPQRISG
jgi:DNA-binding NtrC family response regulator